MSMTKVAVIGSGNIGTDLMIKVLRLSDALEMGAMVGIDPNSDGLARAARLRVPTTHEGVDGLIALPGFDQIGIIFDATSAKAHMVGCRRLPHRTSDSGSSHSRQMAPHDTTPQTTTNQAQDLQSLDVPLHMSAPQRPQWSQ